MSALRDLAAVVGLEALSLRWSRRPRPVSPFTAHVLPQRWHTCEDHGFAGFVSVLEPGCGCPTDMPRSSLPPLPPEPPDEVPLGPAPHVTWKPKFSRKAKPATAAEAV